MTNSDRNSDLTKLDTLPLLHADVSWAQHHEAFRHIVDKKRLAKLVRNCDYVAYNDPFAAWQLKLQKTAFLSSLAALPDDVQVACVFNGYDLLILGILLTDAEVN
jgi:hypothetical protein